MYLLLKIISGAGLLNETLLMRTIPVISVARALIAIVTWWIIDEDLFNFDKLKAVIPSFFLVFVFFVATLVLPAWLLELSFRLLLGGHLRSLATVADLRELALEFSDLFPQQLLLELLLALEQVCD